MGKTVPPNGLDIRFQRIVRPTLPGVSVAPITATVWGEKNTFRGELFCSTALREDLPGLIACIFVYIRFGVKRRPVQPVNYIAGVEAVFEDDGLDIAGVAGGKE